jgi:acylphosphatase
MERHAVFYSGNVQGVGFRYTARRIAAGFKVVGYVRNLPDGRVELVVEGESHEVTRFLDQVRETMRDYIKQIASDKSPARGEFDRFEIRF